MGRLVEEKALRNRHRVFRDREDAGERLGRKLSGLVSSEALILAIPSGGVPVGCQVARVLGSRLEVIITRKIPIPGETEAGFGALSFDGEAFYNTALVESLGLTRSQIEGQEEKVRAQIERRERLFSREFPSLEGREAVIVDDGLASGYTMLAALSSVRGRGASRVVVAVPTAPLTTVNFLLPGADLLCCLNVREESHFAVASAYEEWHDLSEEEVIFLPP